jgi:hypothetical protein
MRARAFYRPEKNTEKSFEVNAHRARVFRAFLGRGAGSESSSFARDS